LSPRWASVLLTQGIVVILALAVLLTPYLPIAATAPRSNGETGFAYQLANNSTREQPYGTVWAGGPVTTGGPLIYSGDTPATQQSSPPKWFYGTVASPLIPENAYSIYYNITVPQVGTTGDSLAVLASAFDSNLAYDQMGINAGPYAINDPPTVYAETGEPCSGAYANYWCGIFSIQTLNYDGQCTFYAPFYQWEFGPLSTGNPYEFEMTFAGQPSGELAGYLYFMGPSDPHTLLTNFTFLTGGTHFSVANSGGCSDTAQGFTDYEEVNSVNSLEAWPAFNFHSDVEILPVSGTTQLQWTDICVAGGYGACPPSGFPGQYTTGFSSGHNVVTIQNQPFLVAIGTNFGHGQAIDAISHLALPVNFYVPIDPMADPDAGYSVDYSYDYCSIPCSDVSFSGSPAAVQPWSSNWHTAGKMLVSLPLGFTLGTYPMNLYSCSAGNCDISQWILIIT